MLNNKRANLAFTRLGRQPDVNKSGVSVVPASSEPLCVLLAERDESISDMMGIHGAYVLRGEPGPRGFM